MIKQTVDNRFKNAFRHTLIPFLNILPILLGVLALASLFTEVIPPEVLAEALPKGSIFGPLLGALTGSVAVGHPITSYIIGGELKEAGVGFATIAAFLVSWVTVGVVQLPAEIAALGKRFALVRNALCFLSSIAIAYLAGWTMEIVG